MCKFKNIKIDLSINHKIVLSYLSFFFAVGFAIAGIAIYPPGVIHGSVLILVAQLLVLCGTLLGLNIKFDLQEKYFHAHQHDSTTKDELAQIQQAVDEQFPKEEKA